MKIKPILKYQLRDYRNTIRIMYLCVYVFVTIAMISNSKVNGLTLSGKVIHSGICGVELASLITLFVIALNSFKPYFKLFSANGVSRRTLFCSVTAGMGITAVAMALIDTLNTLLFSRFMNYQSMFGMMYQNRFTEALVNSGSQSVQYTLPVLVQQFSWLFFAYLLIAMVGFFITNLFYRMSKGLKLVVFIGTPVLLGNFLPILDQLFWGNRLAHAIQNFVNFAWGFSNGYNPYIGMASMFVFAAVAAALAWLLVRRANVKA